MEESITAPNDKYYLADLSFRSARLGNKIFKKMQKPVLRYRVQWKKICYDGCDGKILLPILNLKGR